MGWDGSGMGIDIAFKQIEDFIRQNNLNLRPRMSGAEVERALASIIEAEGPFDAMMWPGIVDPQTKPFLQGVSLALADIKSDSEKLAYLDRHISGLIDFVESNRKYVRKSYPQTSDSPKLT